MEGNDVKTANCEGLPTDFDQLELSEWGLDWGDISLIRDKLAMTPTERLRAVQSFMQTVVKLRNGRRT